MIDPRVIDVFVLLSKTVKKTLFIIIVLITYTYGEQSRSYVSGIILDKNTSKALAGANIVFNNLNDTTLVFTYSDNNGWFILHNLPYGSYRMEVTHIGYQKIIKRILVKREKVELGKIFLRPKSIPLQRVVVIHVVESAAQIGDTTQYNADAFTTTQDATAEDLILRMPGIVSKNGTIQALGENVVRVLVDGKSVFGGDPSIPLKNLPAEVIDKIQIYDQQSDLSLLTGIDDGSKNKTINIVIKPSMKIGRFGNIYCGYGLPNNLYKVGANLNYFSGKRRITIITQSNNINVYNFGMNDLLDVMTGGAARHSIDEGIGYHNIDGGMGGLTNTHIFGLNFQDEWFNKFEIVGNYLFNFIDNENKYIYSHRYFRDTEIDQQYNVNNSRNRNINHKFKLRIDYNITERDKIIIKPLLVVQLNDRRFIAHSETFFNDSFLSALNSHYRLNRTGISLTNNIFYTHEFIKNKRLLIFSLNSVHNGRDGVNYQESLIATESDSEFVNRQSQVVAFHRNINADISFVEDLGRFGRATVHYNIDRNPNSSDKKTYNYTNETDMYSTIDTAYSNVFDQNGLTQEIGIGHSLNYNKFKLDSRIDFHVLTMINKQSYPIFLRNKESFKSILPSIVLRYKFNATSNILFRYDGTATPPSITQLQEVLDSRNPEALSIGNSNLVQQFNHLISINFAATNIDKTTFFYLTVSGNYVENYIGNRTIFATTDSKTWNNIKVSEGCQLIIPENLSGYYTLRLFSVYGLPMKIIKSNLSLNISGTYSRIPGYFNESRYIANNFIGSIRVGINSNISRNFNYSISSRLTVNSLYNNLNVMGNAFYYHYRSSLLLDWTIWRGFYLQTDFNYQFSEQNLSDLKNTALLWNIIFGKKFLKNNRGDLQIYFNDVLNRNNNLTNQVTEIYTEESQSEILGRYLTVMFTYRFRKFPALKK